MIADRRSQIADRNKVCDRLRSYGNYFCDRLRSCDRDRRRSQKIEPCSISCDRLRSIAIVCDLRSAICDPRSYGNQPLDRTWFYLLRSSAITIAGSQTLLRSAIIWKPAFNSRRFGVIVTPFSRQSGKLMRRFDFYTLQSLQISILTKDHKFLRWIPLRESSLFARLGMV